MILEKNFEKKKQIHQYSHSSSIAYFSPVVDLRNLEYILVLPVVERDGYQRFQPDDRVAATNGEGAHATSSLAARHDVSHSFVAVAVRPWLVDEKHLGGPDRSDTSFWLLLPLFFFDLLLPSWLSGADELESF